MPVSRNRKIPVILHHIDDEVVIDRQGRKGFRSDRKKQGNKGMPKWVYPQIPEHPKPGLPSNA